MSAVLNQSQAKEYTQSSTRLRKQSEKLGLLCVDKSTLHTHCKDIVGKNEYWRYASLMHKIYDMKERSIFALNEVMKILCKQIMNEFLSVKSFVCQCTGVCVFVMFVKVHEGKEDA